MLAPETEEQAQILASVETFLTRNLPLTVALVQERLGRHAHMVASIFNRVVGFGLMSLLGYGSAAQRREVPPLLMAGEAFCALALTEPQAGSDAEGARCLIHPARTGPEREGHRGISVFLVPTNAPGIAMTVLPKIGNNCARDLGLMTRSAT